MLALTKMAQRLDLQPEELKVTLKRTVFAACRSEEEFAALIIISQTYGLNPILKEIYAFPSKAGGIVPMVSVDGWLRIINDHPQMDGMTVSMSDDGTECTVTIHRKDRSHPVVISEHLSECLRKTDPWAMMPRRMLRHKAIIQAGRVAFGFGGIHDEDDAADIGAVSKDNADQRPALREQLKIMAKAQGVSLADLPGIASRAGLLLDDGKLSLEALQAMTADFTKFIPSAIEVDVVEEDIL